MQAAKLLKVSDQTILDWHTEKLFPNAYRLNPNKKKSRIRIPRRDVEAILKMQGRALDE